MFCLRSWLPLLFLPLNSPPIFVLCFFALNYLANRPCLYCSLLLVLLFASSCAWADACFLDLTSNWFESPRHKFAADSAGATACGNSTNSTAFMVEVLGSTAVACAEAAVETIKAVVGTAAGRAVATSSMVDWVKNLGLRGVRIPCLNVVVRL